MIMKPHKFEPAEDIESSDLKFLPTGIISWFDSHYKKPTIRPQRVIQDFNLSEGVVYNALASGEIPSFKIGGRWLIPTQELKKWFESKYSLT